MFSINQINAVVWQDGMLRNIVCFGLVSIFLLFSLCDNQEGQLHSSKGIHLFLKCWLNFIFNCIKRTHLYVLDRMSYHNLNQELIKRGADPQFPRWESIIVHMKGEDSLKFTEKIQNFTFICKSAVKEITNGYSSVSRTKTMYYVLVAHLKISNHWACL